jgi:hypothetical protein
MYQILVADRLGAGTVKSNKKKSLYGRENLHCSQFQLRLGILYTRHERADINTGLIGRCCRV